jgi:hypothetical protein
MSTMPVTHPVLRPPRMVLRITSMLSGPGARITRVEARAKPSSAVVTGPSYAARPPPGITFPRGTAVTMLPASHSLFHPDTG